MDEQDVGPYLLVDLSNICRDESVVGKGDGADWNAYLRLLQAVRSSNIQFSRTLLIADASLRHHMDAAGRAELRRHEQRGDLEVTSLADERLLSYAFDKGTKYSGALIATLDRFDDFRRRFPQIQGNKDRFVGWRVRNGLLEAYFRDMGTSGHNTMSRKEERGVLKERKLRRDEVTARAESTFFRCANDDCLVRKLWPDHLRELPRYDDRRDVFLCPACRTQLESAGPRPHSVQLIVFCAGAERARILLQHGETITVGRSDANDCIGLTRLLGDHDSSAVSRRHAQFRLESSSVEVRDIGSKNGSTLQRNQSDSPKKLAPNRWTRFGRGHILGLASGLSIELSGRRIAFDGERPLSAKPPDGTDSPTRLG